VASRDAAPIATSMATEQGIAQKGRWADRASSNQHPVMGTAFALLASKEKSDGEPFRG
jgi:hypothetical protein